MLLLVSAALAHALTTVANANAVYNAPVTAVEKKRRSVHSIGDPRSDTTAIIATTALATAATVIATAAETIIANTASTATTTKEECRSSMHSIS